MIEQVDKKYLSECKKLFRRSPWEPGAQLLNREVKYDWSYRVMKQVAGRVSHRPRHGHYISLSNNTDAIVSAYLRLDDCNTGAGIARLELYPGDDIEQARALYPNVEIERLNDLRAKGWPVVRTNLHFGGSFGRGWPPRVDRPPIGFSRYVEFWKRNLDKLKTYKRSELKSMLRDLRRQGFLPDDVEADDLKRLASFKKIGVRPGLKLIFKWPAFKSKLPKPETFAPEVREKIDEASKHGVAIITSLRCAANNNAAFILALPT